MATRIPFDLSTMAMPGPRRLPSSNSLTVWPRALIARWRERRILEEMDDRMLRDIGISRSQALAEAAKPFWRR
jgi:uncharacterized protein YjiS (DUF1127 family)